MAGKIRPDTIRVNCYIPEPYASRFRQMHKREIERQLAGEGKPKIMSLDAYAAHLLRMAIDAMEE